MVRQGLRVHRVQPVRGGIGANQDHQGLPALGASTAPLGPPGRVASLDQPGLPGRWAQQVRPAQQDLPIHSKGRGPSQVVFIDGALE